MIEEEVRSLLELYPKVFFACHDRHSRSPEIRKRLTAQQSDIIDHLDYRRPSTLKELAGHMGVTSSTMSINVERLVRLGYVSRSAALENRREIAIRLTEEGQKIKESDQVLAPERVKRLLQSLTDEDRRKAIEGLAILASAANGMRYQMETTK